MKKAILFAALFAAFTAESNAQLGNLTNRIKKAKNQVQQALSPGSSSSSSTGTTTTQFVKAAKQGGRFCPPRDYKRYDKSNDIEWCRQMMTEAVEPYKDNNSFIATWTKVDDKYYMPDVILAERGLYEYYMDHQTDFQAFKDILLPIYLRTEVTYYDLGKETELLKQGIEAEEGSGMLYNRTRWLAEDALKTARQYMTHDDLLGWWRSMITEIDEGIEKGDFHETIYKCTLQRYLFKKVICSCTNKQFDEEERNGKLNSTYDRLSLEYADYKKINELRLQSAIAKNPPQKFKAGVAAPSVAAKAEALMKQRFGDKFVKISWITNQWQQLKQNGVFSTRKMEFDVLIKEGNEYQSFNSALWEDYAPIVGRWTGNYHISEPNRNPYKVIYP